MAKEYRLVWSDQQNKLVVVQAQALAARKPFAARIAATALAATALTALGAPEARAAEACSIVHTADTTISANTSGPICFEKSLTVNSGVTITGTKTGVLLNDQSATGSFINKGTIFTDPVPPVGPVPTQQEATRLAAGIAVRLGEGATRGTISGDFINDGTIEYTGQAGRAVVLYNGQIGGKFVNNGSITSDGGMLVGTGFTVFGNFINDGTIEAVGSISGNDGIQVDGIIEGSIINGANNSAAIISSKSETGLAISGTVKGAIVNHGIISGGNAAYGAMFVNGEVLGGIENKATGKIITETGSAGIYLSYDAKVSSIKNEGIISGKSYGIYFYSAANQTSVTNSGIISGGYAGAYLSYASTGALNNSGRISGDTYGIYASSANIAGGITNQAGGVIESANSHGILLYSGALSGGIRNAGKISGAANAVYLDAVNSFEGSTTIGDIINEKSGEMLGADGSGLDVTSTPVNRIDNAGIMRGERNGIYLSSSTVAEGIVNSGLIEGTMTPTSWPYQANGLTVLDSAVNRGILNTETGSILGSKNGIYIGGESLFSGTLVNKGLIGGGEFEGERYFAVDDTIDAIESIVIDGNNTARFIGAVSAFNADVTIARGATYTVRDNVFYVDSFTNEGTTIFDEAAGWAFLHLADPDNGYVFQNKGTVSVVGGTTGFLNGDYAQTADGAFQIAIGSGGEVVNDAFTGEYGKLLVSGNVDLADGTTIRVVMPSGASALKNGTLIEGVIVAEGELTATDTAITVVDNSLLYDFTASLSRAANELDLVTQFDPTAISRSVVLGGRPVALGSAKVLEGMLGGTMPAAMQPVFDRIGTMESLDEIATAVAQTLPVMLGATPQSLVSGLRSTNKFIQSRIESNQGLSAGDVDGGKHLWGRAFGTWSKQDDQDSVAGFRSDTQGLVLGYDGTVGDALRIGFAAAYANSNVKGSIAGAGQNVKVDSYELITFGSYNAAPHTDINYQFDIGLNKAKASREIPFMDSTAHARFSSFVLRGGVGVGHTLALGDNTTLTPAARVDYTYMRTGDYTETGAGPHNLKVDASTYDELVLSGDLKLKQQLGPKVELTLNAGGGYDALNDATVTVASFVGGGPAFTTTGLKVSPWLYRGGAGLARKGEGVELSLRY